MRSDSLGLEEKRLQDVEEISDYHAYHERHRIFPSVFENRRHERILDISAGVGLVGKNIKEGYPSDLLCNDASPTCLRLMEQMGLNTVSFDLDVAEKAYPLDDKRFNAVISLATIEHLIHVDHFLSEIERILADDGYLYISAPNYSGLTYLLPFLISGKTFHDPLSADSRYEFYAHVRYFTYRTLVELISSFGFALDSVYLPIPHSSSRYTALKSRSAVKAFIFRSAMIAIYRFLSPRWAAEPILCFRKSENPRTSDQRSPRKILL